MLILASGAMLAPATCVFDSHCECFLFCPRFAATFNMQYSGGESQEQVCGALSALSCGQRTLLYLSLIHGPLWHMNCHCAGTNPPQRLQHIENPVPRVALRIVPLHNVNHASAVPGVTPHHVDVPVKHRDTNIALAPWHWWHRRPLVCLWAVVFAAQDVVVVAGASEVIPAHDVESVADGAHAVQAAELHHVGSSAPRVSAGVVTPKLPLERVTCDSACVRKDHRIFQCVKTNKQTFPFKRSHRSKNAF